MKRVLLVALAFAGLGGVAITAVFSYILVVAPHMVDQPHLRAFEAAMPLPPAGSVPVETQNFAPPPGVATAANPLESSRENVERGAIYYGYYCLQCHGENGAGDGPVGESYMPAPANLAADRIRELSDGELRRAMLLGVGHEPVLAGIVPAAHRWYLVVFLRTLGGKNEN